MLDLEVIAGAIAELVGELLTPEIIGNILRKFRPRMPHAIDRYVCDCRRPRLLFDPLPNSKCWTGFELAFIDSPRKDSADQALDAVCLRTTGLCHRRPLLL